MSDNSEKETDVARVEISETPASQVTKEYTFFKLKVQCEGLGAEISPPCCPAMFYSSPEWTITGSTERLSGFSWL